MFIKPWRVGIICVIYILHLNVISGTRRSYPSHIFHNSNRRILNGVEAANTRPYMVWLRPDAECEHPNWLCGGVIIHEFFVLTSAACIEDVKRFYVVSGTSKWVPLSDNSNECIKNGAVRAVWKCVPKAYHFDGKQFENIRWMMYDLAIVRVEEPFNFLKRVRGCDFIPAAIRYNNFNEDLEKPGTIGSTAGWGSTFRYSHKNDKKNEENDEKKNEDGEKKEGEKNEEGEKKEEEEGEKTRRSGMGDSSTTGNSPVLLETDVLLINKKKCKARWPVQHHAIIDQHMICGKSTDTKALGSMCMENDLNCKDIVYEEYKAEDEDDTTTVKNDEKDSEGEDTTTTVAPETEEPETKTDDTRRFFEVEADVHGPKHDFEDGRRSAKAGNKFGGFCENDHGGPLVVGRGKEAVVVGIITACMSKPRTHECYGPFLFTSIYKYKHLIACATEKVEGAHTTSHACRNALRSTKTELKRTRFEWAYSKRSVMSAEDDLNTNSSINDLPLYDAGSHERTRRQVTESVGPKIGKGLNSRIEEIAKAFMKNWGTNPLNASVREITDTGKPVPGDLPPIDIKEVTEIGKGFNSRIEEIAKKIMKIRGTNTLYAGVTEITDTVKPVLGDLPPIDIEEPTSWKLNRRRARIARARKALGLPVTNTEGGATTHSTKATTEKYFPVVTYAVDSPSNLRDVRGDETELMRRRSRKIAPRIIN